jgi:serine/threonine-protein kinase
VHDVQQRLHAALRGRYALQRELGAGGMATVYLARDERHDREVAIKVLHPDLGAALGGERFLAEIKVTAKLQHPHILPLLDSGEADGLLFYVMPYVTGETLRARLVREKLLPIDEALRIAREVGDALQHAHAQGVIHRDIKPENILLQDGHALVADFGIALAVQSAGGARMTQTGLSLGTPQYMSPEQAMGERAVDARTDVYALGAVTYEMLTGDPPFTGSTVQAIVAKVLTEKPTAPSAVRDTVGAGVEQAVLKALAKLPADRFASARAFVEALERPGSAGAAATASGARGAALAPAGRGASRAVLAALGVMTIVAAVAVAGWWRAAHGGGMASAGGEVRFSVELPAGQQLIEVPRPFAVSNDGRLVVVVAEGPDRVARLWVRQVGEVSAIELKGTDGATSPAFSPDGKWIAFVAREKLRKVPSTGGPVTDLAEVVGEETGTAWGSAGLIFVGHQGRIASVPEAGGELTEGDHAGVAPGVSERYPVALPDGRSYLFTTWGGSIQGARVWYRSLDGGPAKPIGADSVTGVGVANGWLVLGGSAGTLRLVRIAPDFQSVRGASRQVMDGLSVVIQVPMATMSPSGVLLVQQGQGLADLVVRGVRGDSAVIPAERHEWADVRLSPDGKRVAAASTRRTGTDLWIVDRASGATSRLTTDGRTNSRSDWTPDGERVVYRAERDRHTELWIQPASGGTATPFYRAVNRDIWEVTLSPDGQWMLYRTGTLGTADIWYRRLRDDTTSRPFAATPATEAEARFSPDGKWVAYSSSESGTSQVYVRAFPDGAARYQVSVDGGMQPVWAPDGKAIFYVPAVSGTIMRARLAIGRDVAVTSREVVLKGRYYLPVRNGHALYDVLPDGEHLLLIRRVDASQPVVGSVGWLAEAVQRYEAAGATP